MSLPVVPAGKLPTRAAEQRWLVEQLWSAEAVGIIGGEPKCGKSLLALDLAVSVASATPCLGRFATAQSGRVLLFAAEDPLPVVRERLQGLSGVPLRSPGVTLTSHFGLWTLDFGLRAKPALRGR